MAIKIRIVTTSKNPPTWRMFCGDWTGSTGIPAPVNESRLRLLPRPTGLWRNTDFVKLWFGQTVSTLGTLMGALQLTAVLVLHSSPFQMGLLAALRVAPGIVFGLAAGVWADRLRRRPILIAADLCRAGLMGSIPIVHVFGTLRIEQLYVVAFVSGAMTIFFDTAYRSYLPSLVPRTAPRNAYASHARRARGARGFRVPRQRASHSRVSRGP